MGYFHEISRIGPVKTCIQNVKAWLAVFVVPLPIYRRFSREWFFCQGTLYIMPACA